VRLETEPLGMTNSSRSGSETSCAPAVPGLKDTDSRDHIHHHYSSQSMKLCHTHFKASGLHHGLASDVPNMSMRFNYTTFLLAEAYHNTTIVQCAPRHHKVASIYVPQFVSEQASNLTSCLPHLRSCYREYVHYV